MSIFGRKKGPEGPNGGPPENVNGGSPEQPPTRPVSELKTGADFQAEIARRAAAQTAAEQRTAEDLIADARKLVQEALDSAAVEPEKDPKVIEQIKAELGGEQVQSPPPSSGHDFLRILEERKRQRGEDAGDK